MCAALKSQHIRLDSWFTGCDFPSFAMNQLATAIRRRHLAAQTAFSQPATRVSKFYNRCNPSCLLHSLPHFPPLPLALCGFRLDPYMVPYAVGLLGPEHLITSYVGTSKCQPRKLRMQPGPDHMLDRLPDRFFRQDRSNRMQKKECQIECHDRCKMECHEDSEEECQARCKVDCNIERLKE